MMIQTARDCARHRWDGLKVSQRGEKWWHTGHARKSNPISLSICTSSKGRKQFSEWNSESLSSRRVQRIREICDFSTSSVYSRQEILTLFKIIKFFMFRRLSDDKVSLNALRIVGRKETAGRVEIQVGGGKECRLIPFSRRFTCEVHVEGRESFITWRANR